MLPVASGLSVQCDSAYGIHRLSGFSFISVEMPKITTPSKNWFFYWNNNSMAIMAGTSERMSVKEQAHRHELIHNKCKYSN